MKSVTAMINHTIYPYYILDGCILYQSSKWKFEFIGK